MVIGHPLHFQPAGLPVMIGGWAEDEDFAIHPKGSQPKRLLSCPPHTGHPFLIPWHSYIFKTAKKDWQQQQMWSEIIAYRLGVLCGVTVPPAFVAVDGGGQAGCLIEMFLNYPDDPNPPRLTHGGDILQRVIADKKRGRPHSVRRNLMVSNLYKAGDVIGWWASAIAFDALISNVDRHPDNWGVLSTPGPGPLPVNRMSPLFDNGTSLGYGLTEDRVEKIVEAGSFADFCSRGTHHCSWENSPDTPSGHIDLCARYLAAYPGAITTMQSVVGFDLAALSAILAECQGFETSVPFSAARAAFVMGIVSHRKHQLEQLLDGVQHA